MTTNKPEVVAWSVRDEVFISEDDAIEASAFHSSRRDVEPLIRLSDYEALQAECEKLRKDAERYVPLNEAVQRAAAELPEGWEIQLCVVRDSGWVDLIGPDGTEDFEASNERLDCTVLDALEFAIDAAIQGDNQ